VLIDKMPHYTVTDGVLKSSLDGAAVKNKMLEQGNVTQALPPAEFAKVLDSDIQRYRAIIESAKIKLE